MDLHRQRQRTGADTRPSGPRTGLTTHLSGERSAIAGKAEPRRIGGAGEGSMMPLRALHAASSRAASSFVREIVGGGIGVISSSSSKRATDEERLTPVVPLAKNQLREECDSVRSSGSGSSDEEVGGQQDDESNDEDVDGGGKGSMLRIDSCRRRRDLFVAALGEIMNREARDSLQITEIVSGANGILLRCSEEDAVDAVGRKRRTASGCETVPEPPFTDLEARSYLGELDKENRVMITWDSGTVYRI